MPTSPASLPLLSRRVGVSAEELVNLNSSSGAGGTASSTGAYSSRWSSAAMAAVHGDSAQPRCFSGRGSSSGSPQRSPRIQSSAAPLPAGAAIDSPREAPLSFNPAITTNSTPQFLAVMSSNAFSKDATFDRTLMSDDQSSAVRHRLQHQPQQSQPAPLTRLEAVDAYMTVHCARHVTEPQRSTNFRKALGDMGAINPPLAPLLTLVSRYLRETAEALQTVQASHKEELIKHEKQLFKKFDSFFEEKIYGIMKSKKLVEDQAKQLEKEVLDLRKGRDGDLMAVKSELMVKINECEKREDEFRTFRQLISSVFQNNERLTNRIDDLEDILRRHRIDFPPPPPTFADARSSHTNPAHTSSHHDGVRPIASQVSAAFIKASAEEMSAARLTLQKELLNCAFDERTAYRLEVSKLKADNCELRMQLDTMEATITELNRYIHEKRYLDTDDFGQAPLTPRPRNVAFNIQTELGIDLKKHTEEIMAEMGAAAISLKHQLNSALLRLRQMTSVSEWMQEDTLVQLDEQLGGKGVLPTYPVSLWPHVPHFLRTHVYPDVPNLRWKEADTAAIVLDFFRSFKELRRSAMRVRDRKMLQPRVLQMFERRGAILCPVDATSLQMAKNESAVPFGYVVSQFIRRYLTSLPTGPRTTALVLPGTLRPTFNLGAADQVVEMEFCRFAYNLWWSAHYYRDTQPLCRLFVDVAHGRLPIELFDKMNSLLSFVGECVKRLDTDGSRTFTYPKLSFGVMRIVNDLGAEAGRSAILSCTQTFEENDAPIFGGRVSTDVLMTDESNVLSSAVSHPDGVKHTATLLAPRITAARPSRKAAKAPGASAFLRYWRRLIIRQYETEYSEIEKLLGPLVVESEVVLGLYLLPIPEAQQAIEDYDAASSSTEGFLGLPADDPLAESGGAEAYSALISSQREAYKARTASRKQLMKSVFAGLIRDLPRLNRSVHFPFSAPPKMTAVDAAPRGSTQSTATAVPTSSAKLPRKRRSKHSATPATTHSHDFIMSSDREIVEWFGFCYTMRQQLLPLIGKVFVTTPLTDQADWLLSPVISSDEDLPVLYATEEEPPTTSLEQKGKTKPKKG